MATASNNTISLVKWSSTIMALGCATMSSFDIYPINVWLGFLAGVGWSWVGWIWREWSLVAINFGLTLIYGMGVLGSFW